MKDINGSNNQNPIKTSVTTAKIRAKIRNSGLQNAYFIYNLSDDTVDTSDCMASIRSDNH
jgi:hypothetical protein